MTESSAGVYTGSLHGAKNVSVSGAAVLGSLAVGGVASPLIQASGPVTVAGIPPKVTDISPARGATVESDLPLIYATRRYRRHRHGPERDSRVPGRSGCDGAGDGDAGVCQLQADSGARRRAAHRPPAHRGQGRQQDRNRLGLHRFHRQGHPGIHQRRPGGWSHSREHRAFPTDGPARRPGRVSVGSLANDLPLAETQPGVYTGAYTVHPGENAQNAPVRATFIAGDGTKVNTSLKTALTVSGGAPAAPTITDPADGAQVGDPLTVSGRTTPGATVRVKVDFSGKALGGLLPISGAVSSKDVTADKDGRWMAADLPLKANTLFGGSSDTTFTITATAVDSDGDESARRHDSRPAEITRQSHTR